MALSSREARLQAALLAPGRFSDRESLEAAARRRLPREPLGSHERRYLYLADVALATLRQKLGFPSAPAELAEIEAGREDDALLGIVEDAELLMAHVDDRLRGDGDYARALLALGPEDRRIYCARHAMDKDFQRFLNSSLQVWKGTCAMAASNREIVRGRRLLARVGTEPRKPGAFLRERVGRELKAQVMRAGFRTGTPLILEAGNHLELVDRGHEGISPKKGAGGHIHTWRVSVSFLSPEVRALNAFAPIGVLYLTPTLRVRQGRGTALVEERKTERGAWR